MSNSRNNYCRTIKNWLTSGWSICVRGTVHSSCRSAIGQRRSQEVVAIFMKSVVTFWNPAQWSNGEITGLELSTSDNTTRRHLQDSFLRLADYTMFITFGVCWSNRFSPSLTSEVSCDKMQLVRKGIKVSWWLLAYHRLQGFANKKGNSWGRLEEARVGRVCCLHCSTNSRDGLKDPSSHQLFPVAVEKKTCTIISIKVYKVTYNNNK